MNQKRSVTETIYFFSHLVEDHLGYFRVFVQGQTVRIDNLQ